MKGEKPIGEQTNSLSKVNSPSKYNNIVIKSQQLQRLKKTKLSKNIDEKQQITNINPCKNQQLRKKNQQKQKDSINTPIINNLRQTTKDLLQIIKKSKSNKNIKSQKKSTQVIILPTNLNPCANTKSKKPQSQKIQMHSPHQKHYRSQYNNCETVKQESQHIMVKLQELQNNTVTADEQQQFWLKTVSFESKQQLTKCILRHIVQNRIVKDEQYDQLFEQIVGKFNEKQKLIKQCMVDILSYLDQ